MSDTTAESSTVASWIIGLVIAGLLTISCSGKEDDVLLKQQPREADDRNGLEISANGRPPVDFERAIATMRAVTRASEPEIGALTEEALRLEARTWFFAKEVADCIVLLAHKGFSATEIQSALEATLLLKQVGDYEIGHAIEVTIDALKGFNLEVDQSEHVVDVLAFTSTSTGIDIEQLVKATRLAAPIVSRVDLPTETTAAALGVLFEAGLPPSIVGAGFRRMLSGLENPNTTTLRQLANVGLGAVDIKPSRLGLSRALERINEAERRSGNLFDATTAFGQLGGLGFELLASDTVRLRELDVENAHAGGTAQMLVRRRW